MGFGPRPFFAFSLRLAGTREYARRIIDCAARRVIELQEQRHRCSGSERPAFRIGAPDGAEHPVTPLRLPTRRPASVSRSQAQHPTRQPRDIRQIYLLNEPAGRPIKPETAADNLNSGADVRSNERQERRRHSLRTAHMSQPRPARSAPRTEDIARCRSRRESHVDPAAKNPSASRRPTHRIRRRRQLIFGREVRDVVCGDGRRNTMGDRSTVAPVLENVARSAGALRTRSGNGMR